MLPDFGFDPVAVSRGEALDRPYGDGGDFVAVEVGDAGDEGVGSLDRRLEQGRDFRGLLDLALPAVDRVAGAEDVDAGGEFFVDDGSADALRFVGVGEAVGG